MNIKQKPVVLGAALLLSTSMLLTACGGAEQNSAADSTSTITPTATAAPTLIPTEEPVATEAPTSTPEVSLPDYEVYSVDDTSFSNVVRKTLNIVVTDDYTLDELEAIAHKEILSYTAKNSVNAIVAGFFTSENHIGSGYEMGCVEYVPNGVFADADEVSTGDYSSFEFVNKLSEPIFEKGESITEGTSDLKQIKKDFEDIYDDSAVSISVELKNGTLYVTAKEPDQPYFSADENAISAYTDYALDNFKSDIKYLDITVKRPSSSVSALLDMDKMSTDFGRYFDLYYIIQNLK